MTGGEVASAATLRRGSLLYKTDIHDEPIAKIKSILLITLGVCAVSSFAAVDGTRLQSLRDAGIVDADTIAYLPMDAIGGTAVNDYLLDNYAYGSHKMDAKIDVTIANSVTVSAGVFGTDCAVRGGWTNHVDITNGGSFQFTQNPSATAGKTGSVWFSDPNHVIMSDTFTFEAFYRWDSQPSTTHYFLSQHTKNENGDNAFAVQGLLLSNGKLRISALTGTYDAGSGELVSTTSRSGDTAYSCVDGKWHHVAVVYDKTAKTFKAYVDYRKILDVAGFTTVVKQSGYHKAFIIGNGYYSNSPYANTDGGLDEIRVTRRALSVNEFLFPEKYVDTDTIAWVSFEDGELGMWPYSCARQPSATNAVIRFADDTIGGVGIRTKDKTPLRTGNAKSFSLWDNGTGAWIEYMNDPLVNGTTLDAVTIEFFAKGTEALSYGLMVAIAGAAEGDSFTNNVMAVRVPNQNTASNVGYYQGHFYDSENNQRGDVYKNENSPQNVTTDGAWHHIAATFRQSGDKVIHEGYYDHKKVAEFQVPVYAAQHSYLRTNLVHSVLQIGHGVIGCLDELRISKGVLPVGKFLYRDNGTHSFIMIIR